MLDHFEKFESYVPIDLLNLNSMLIAFVIISGVVIFRYLLLTLIFYIPYYKLKSPWTLKQQLYRELPARKIQLFEIKWSIISSIIFGASGLALGILWQLGMTRIYLSFTEFGVTYLFISFVLISLIHDLYFYLAHRALHIPWAMKRFHAFHHKSLTPSPWASFSFHPIEALILAIPIPLFVLFLPLHPVVILTYLTFMTLSAIINHLGFEVMPRKFLMGPFGKQFISGTHHAEHHKSFNCNYGLFYTFWDRLLKTQRES